MSVSLPALILLVFLVVQRLCELLLSGRNTRRLLAKGATEYGAGHYPYMIGLHGAWFAALAWFGIGQILSFPWLAVFVALQAMRVWIICSLGSRWTTRIIVLPAPLVTTGPFAWVKHPNYLLVIAEIFTVPMIFGLPTVAAIFSALNAAMLTVRISAEEAALAQWR
ncbi:isoprenylcysteine carboxyl methyltransferase family protein [Hoeflea sp. TYP-13]|uniref:isoprenylcysteine carboxyl methyltransferase family protein n=1 Tax=Hoeflea sp. TYP-13 TaxID=3230023 RepID=UPI0034C5E963